MGDIGSSFADVPVHLPHDRDMLIAIEERMFVVSGISGLAPPTRAGNFVGLEGGIGQDNDQPLCVLVASRYRHMLFSYHLRKFWWRARLSSCGAFRQLSHVCGTRGIF